MPSPLTPPPTEQNLLNKEQLDALASIHDFIVRNHPKGEKAFYAFGRMCADHAVIPNLLAHIAALEQKAARCEDVEEENESLRTAIEVLVEAIDDMPVDPEQAFGSKFWKTVSNIHPSPMTPTKLP